MGRFSEKVIVIVPILSVCVIILTLVACFQLGKMNVERKRQAIMAEEILKRIEEYNSSLNEVSGSIREASPYVSDERARHLGSLFLEYSGKSGIPIRTFLIIGKVESDFRRIRSGNDYGVMQINRFWLEKLGVSPSEAMNDRTNIDLFVKILDRLQDKPLSYYHSFKPRLRKRYEKRLMEVTAFLQ